MTIHHAWIDARIREARQGDLAAFGEVVEHLQGVIRGYACMAGAPASEAEELAQRAFVEAFTNLAAFDPAQPFLPWLRGITRHVVLRWIDREAVEARYRGTQVRRMLAGALEAAPEHGCADPRFDLELLQRCVDRLKPDARSLIEQSYFAGLDTPAMAKLRDSTLDAIWMALSRARAALRQCIEAKLRQTGTGP